MFGILGGIGAFYYTFSVQNHDRIKMGSKKFTEISQQTSLQENIPKDK